jgi:phage gpG-like protein
MANRKVKFDFDPLIVAGVKKRVPKSIREDVITSVAEMLEREILAYTKRGTSPVEDGDWQRSLSKSYLKKKKAQGGASYSDLRLDGDLMSSLEVGQFGNKLRVTVSDDQQGKADGHNNFSGNSPLPERQFIPDETKGQHFDQKIIKKIAKIVNEIVDGD